MNRRCFFGTLAGAIVAQPMIPALAETLPVIHCTVLSRHAPPRTFVGAFGAAPLMLHGTQSVIARGAVDAFAKDYLSQQGLRG